MSADACTLKPSIAHSFYDWMPNAMPHWAFVKPETPRKKVVVKVAQPDVAYEDCNILCRNYEPLHAKAKKLVAEKYRSVEKEFAELNRENARRLRKKHQKVTKDTEKSRKGCSPKSGKPGKDLSVDRESGDEAPTDEMLCQNVQWRGRIEENRLRNITFSRVAADRMALLSETAEKLRSNINWWRRQDRLLGKFKKIPKDIQKCYEELWHTLTRKCPPSKRQSLESQANDPRTAPLMIDAGVVKGILAAVGMRARGRDENVAMQRLLEEFVGKDPEIDNQTFESSLVLLAVDTSAKVRMSFMDAGATSHYLAFGKFSDGTGLLDCDHAKTCIYECTRGFSTIGDRGGEALLQKLFKEHEDEMQPMVQGVRGMPFQVFQTIIQKYREEVLWKGHKMERKIATDYSIPNEVVHDQLHGELVPLHVVFQKLTMLDNGFATWNEIVECLWALGIMPRGKTARNNAMFHLIRESKCKTHPYDYTFMMYVNIVVHLHELNELSYLSCVTKIFNFFDANNSGTLDMSELFKVFVSMGISPRTQEDQNSLRSVIETQRDESVSDAITMPEFARLYGLVVELFQRQQYIRDEALAAKLGFNLREVARFREAYMDIENNEQEGVDILGLRTLLKNLKLYVSAEVLKSQFMQLDSDLSGYLDFSEFLTLMHQLVAIRSNRTSIFSHKPDSLETLTRFDSLQLWKTAEALNMDCGVRTMRESELIRQISGKLRGIGIDPDADFAKTLHIGDHDDFISLIKATLTLPTSPRRDVRVRMSVDDISDGTESDQLGSGSITD